MTLYVDAVSAESSQDEMAEFADAADKSPRKSHAELLNAARAGEEPAWEELIRRYGGLVQATANSFRLQQSDVANVVQSTWLKLFTSASSIRNPEKLGGWLTTTARREALALIRRSRSEITVESIGAERPSSDRTPEDVVVAAETRNEVRAAVGSLTGRSRQLVDALFYEPECSYAELSQRIGLPVGSIGPTRMRALWNLHRELHKASLHPVLRSYRRRLHVELLADTRRPQTS